MSSISFSEKEKSVVYPTLPNKKIDASNENSKQLMVTARVYLSLSIIFEKGEKVQKVILCA